MTEAVQASRFWDRQRDSRSFESGTVYKRR